MTERSRVVQGVAAGLGVLLLCTWPLALIWRAAGSGSLGDLSELRFLGLGVVYSGGLALLTGGLMYRSLASTQGAATRGRLDHWGAYALGVGVFTLVLAAVPAIILLLLVTDENQSLRSRQWLIDTFWVAGHLGAAALGLAAARALLHPRRHRPAEDLRRTASDASTT